MAEELGVDIDTYRGWEETGEDIPISAIYHARITSTSPRSSRQSRRSWTPTTCARGEGEEVERFRYHYHEDIASRYARKIMQPLLVILIPKTNRRAGVPRRPGVQLRVEGSSSSPSGIATSS
ncbi:MAG: hypothetical protein ACLTS2_13155 [Eggerthella lenta]